MAGVVLALKEKYPDALCALEYSDNPWRLLVMGRLSAQCTDKRVNEVSVPLFTRFPTPADMAAADVSEIEEIIKPCGLFRIKARDIKAESEMLVHEFGGNLPSDIDSLLKFPGVGRKIANLLRGDIFSLPAIVTDTHCIRICGKLGFYPRSNKNPFAIEKILTEITEPEEQSSLCHRLVIFGRDICTARSPECEICPLGERGLCDYKNVKTAEIRRADSQRKQYKAHKEKAAEGTTADGECGTVPNNGGNAERTSD